MTPLTPAGFGARMRVASSKIGRSALPFVSIRMIGDKIADDPVGKKAKIAAGVVRAITEVTDLTDEDVWVVFEEVSPADWHIGPDSVEKIWKRKRKPA